ncbi:MAG: alpha/beta hydrolase [Chitinophagaceae bacterium]|nr:MAG: alpha/beta hydrolase [Chitinophagaceae bacterium]
MKYITTKDAATGEEIQLSYKDYGQGRPVVLIHGWPSSKDMWEYQIDDLVNAGLRVIKYDRRGFGKSSKPWNGYDYDSLTDDLHAILEQLDLTDAVLVGFSMGGGETVRYLSKYGNSGRVSKIVLVSSVVPYLAQTNDNPDGVPQAVFAEMMENMKEDRINFLEDFGKQFFGVGLLNKPVSTPYLQYFRSLAEVALPRATQQCAISFANTDFRSDVEAINIPTLIIHGDADKTVPIEASSNRTAKLIPNAIYKVYEGAPHGLFFTERKRLNQDLIEFCSEGAAQQAYQAKEGKQISL